MDHLAELGNLSEALKAERQLYVNITQNTNPTAAESPSQGHPGQGHPSQGHPGQGHPMDSTHALDIELSAVQALRKQLEEGIKRNKEIRNNLLQQQATTGSSGNEGRKNNRLIQGNFFKPFLGSYCWSSGIFY